MVKLKIISLILKTTQNMVEPQKTPALSGVFCFFNVNLMYPIFE